MTSRNFTQTASAMQILNAIKGDPTPRVEYVSFSNRYMWAGAVPVFMVCKRVDGNPLSTQEQRGIIKFGRIGGIHQSLTFESQEAAREFGAQYGY